MFGSKLLFKINLFLFSKILESIPIPMSDTSRLVKGDTIPFTQVSNNVLYSDKLSFKAKGLYAYMMAKPNGWEFSAERIARESKEGRDSILSALKELRNIGLLDYEKSSNGRSIYTIYSELKPKTENPTQENPTQDYPTDKKQITTNKEFRKEEEEEEEAIKSLSQTEFINLLRLDFPKVLIDLKNKSTYYFSATGNLYDWNTNKKVVPSMALEIYKRMYKVRVQLYNYLFQKDMKNKD